MSGCSVGLSQEVLTLLDLLEDRGSRELLVLLGFLGNFGPLPARRPARRVRRFIRVCVVTSDDPTYLLNQLHWITLPAPHISYAGGTNG